MCHCLLKEKKKTNFDKVTKVMKINHKGNKHSHILGTYLVISSPMAHLSNIELFLC